MSGLRGKKYSLLFWILITSICNVVVYSWIPEMVIPFSLIIGQLSVLLIASSKFSNPMKDILLIVAFMMIVGLSIAVFSIGCHMQMFQHCGLNDKQDLVVLTAYFSGIPFGIFILFDRIPKIIRGQRHKLK